MPLPPALQGFLSTWLANVGHRYSAGIKLPNPSGNLWFLTQGTVSLRTTGHFHRVARAPAVLSPVDVGLSGPEILVLEENTVLHQMPAANALALNSGNADWADGMIAATEEDLAATRSAREATYAGMADYFEPSGALIEGPYRSTNVRLVLVVVEDTKRPKLPWNVLPALPGVQRWIRAYSHYTNFRAPGAPSSYEYQELAQLVPCITAAGVGFHTAQMYPDGVMPTAVGRELYAFPKRCAEVWMDGDGGGAAFQGKFLFHTEWSNPTALTLRQWSTELAEALLPSWASTLGVPFVTGLFAWMLGPVIRRLGIPLRIFTDREGYEDSPVTPLGNDEMVRAPFRFKVNGTRRLDLDWLYDVDRLTLQGLGAFEADVDIALHESYSVSDRTGLLRFFRNPWLRAQVPARGVIEWLK